MHMESILRHTAPLKLCFVQAACCCGEPISLVECWAGIAGSVLTQLTCMLGLLLSCFKHQVDLFIFFMSPLKTLA